MQQNSKTVPGKQSYKSALLKDDMRLILRALRLYHKTEPILLPAVFFHNFLLAIHPFLRIYVLAMTLNALYDKKSFREIVSYTMIGLTITMVFYLLQSIAQYYRDLMFKILFHNQDIIINDTLASIDYEYMEDEEIQKMRRALDEQKNYNGGVLFTMFESLEKLFSGFFTICFSIGFTISLFQIYPKKNLHGIALIIASPCTIVCLFTFLGFACFLTTKAAMKQKKAKTEVHEEFMGHSQFAEYYMRTYLHQHQSGKDIRIFHQKELIQEEMKEIETKARISYGKISNLSQKESLQNNLFSVISSILIYFLVGLRAWYGLILVGDAVRYIGSIEQFTDAFNLFMQQFTNLRINNIYLEKYFALLDLPSVKTKGTLPVEQITNNLYEIEFKNVSFRYPNTTDDVLKNVNLKFHLGEKMAVVGRNGSGKTTFIKLVCRLYDPTEGEILLNGRNIKDFEYHGYLSLFSIVFQDFHVFAFPIAQNVGASCHYDEAQVKEALNKAGLDKVIQRMPEGIETTLYHEFSKTGTDISGGEAQKLAIARAVYKNAPFVILDEPTAALDPVAEYEVYSGFNELIGTKTAVYISHRLSSCRFCNDIVVFENGQIVERGSHESLLLKEQGKYRELWDAQAKYYT